MATPSRDSTLYPAEFYRRYEGFGQYLGNKGEARAREALACLSAMGARRTARWLASALEGRGGADGLVRLDEHFLEKPEDLASLTIAHIRRSKRRTP